MDCLGLSLAQGLFRRYTWYGLLGHDPLFSGRSHSSAVWGYHVPVVLVLYVVFRTYRPLVGSRIGGSAHESTWRTSYGTYSTERPGDEPTRRLLTFPSWPGLASEQRSANCRMLLPKSIHSDPRNPDARQTRDKLSADQPCLPWPALDG
jgi:hypothetical protein